MEIDFDIRLIDPMLLKMWMVGTLRSWKSLQRLVSVGEEEGDCMNCLVFSTGTWQDEWYNWTT